MLNLSRFSSTQITIVNGVETYGTWNKYNFLKERPPEDDIDTYEVPASMEGRPDLISQAIYDTPNLYWVLVAFNNARTVLNWPKAGKLIEYPKESVVMTEVLQGVK